MSRLLFEVDDPIRSVEIDGVTWHTETDGRSLIGRRDKTGAPTITNGRTVGIAEMLRRGLALTGATIDVSDLIQFAGKPVYPTTYKCGICLGTKHPCHDKECNCDRCWCDDCDEDGLGETTPEHRWCFVGQETFDANAIATCLAHAELTTGQAVVGLLDNPRRGGRALVVRNDTTRTLIMCGRRDETSDTSAYSRFEIGGAP